MKSMLIAGLGASLICAASSQAAFVVVDTFDGLTGGGAALDGQNGWQKDPSAPAGAFTVVTDPAVGQSDLVVKVDDAFGAWAWKGANIAEEGTTGTLFMQVMKGTGNANSLQGASQATSPTSFGSIAGYNTIGTNTYEMRNGGSLAVADDTWYNLWFVYDNAANTYEAYIQGGAYAAVTQFPANSNLTQQYPFRNTAAGDLINVVLGANNQNTGALYYVDNIYADTDGENLVNPIPEPASLLIGGIGGVILLARRRRA